MTRVPISRWRHQVAAMLLLALAAVTSLRAQPAGPSAASPIADEIDRRAAAVEQEMLGWRRHLHQHPELSNREVQTAQYVAERLRSFGLEPRTGIAGHGVTALLRGSEPGRTVALRADMDGLPVREEVDVPFASRAVAEYGGREVGVMHACGHDTHMAMLLAAARVLTDLGSKLRGNVLFVFQPAEEGVPVAERPAGAELMVTQGVLTNPKVDAIFGLHVFANVPSGHVTWRRGPLMAASDMFEITVRGRQTHGASPWDGVDPIVIASQVVLGLQTIVSRQVNITAQPAIVTVGQFDAGVRNNIIPDTARLVGTIRTFDEQMQSDVHERIRRTAQRIAEAAGGTADVRIDRGPPVTDNDEALMTRMLPTIERVSDSRTSESPRVTTAEDYAYYQRELPGVFLFLGITPPDQVGKAPANHSPQFFVDEAALITGARTLAHLAADYLFGR